MINYCYNEIHNFGIIKNTMNDNITPRLVITAQATEQSFKDTFGGKISEANPNILLSDTPQEELAYFVTAGDSTMKANVTATEAGHTITESLKGEHWKTNTYKGYSPESIQTVELVWENEKIIARTQDDGEWNLQYSGTNESDALLERFIKAVKRETLEIKEIGTPTEIRRRYPNDEHQSAIGSWLLSEARKRQPAPELKLR